MNFSEIESAIRSVMSAQSKQELKLILSENPVLLEKEGLETLMGAVQRAEQEGRTDLSRYLQTAAERIAPFAMSKMALEQSQSLVITGSIEPKVVWAIKARRYLALRNQEIWREAVADAQGQSEIKSFLQAFAAGNISEVDRLGEQLIPKLQQSERREEALTLQMLYLDTRAVLAETYIEYPLEQQKNLRELGIQSCRQIFEIAEILNDKPCQAMYSAVLGSGFSKSRQLPEAESFYTQALRIYQDLTAQEPEIFNKDVAGTLSDLGIVQRNMWKLAAAENSYKEALPIYQALAKQEPQIFNQYLAIALNGLGNVQSDMRKLGDAEKSFIEVLRLFQDFAVQQPSISFNRDIAMALNNLGYVQREMRKLVNAENSFAEARRLFQALAGQQPQAFNREVAMTLNNLGNLQRDMRKPVDAENSFTEALGIFQALARQEPQIFNQYMAAALNDLGNLQREMRKLEDSEKSYTEALQIRRKLAAQEPHIFSKDVATTLNNLGIVQREMQKPAYAEISFDEALQIRRKLAAQEPYIFNQDVATTLDSLGAVQSDMRKQADAEKSYIEALQIRQGLAAQEPQIFNQDVAMTLNNLGIVQSELDKPADAENSYGEALRLFRGLAVEEPQIFDQEVATTLNNLGYLQLRQNRLVEAGKTFETARDLIEDLRATVITIDDRNRILQENINIYNSLLACYLKMKDWKKALEIAELGKSRSLSDLLYLKSEDLQPKAPTPDTLVIVKNLGKKYSDIIKALEQIVSYERFLSEELKRRDYQTKQIENDKDTDDETRQGFLRQIAEQKQPLEQEKRNTQEQRFAEQTELEKILQEIGNYDQDFPPKAKTINADDIFEISKNLNRTIVMFRILRELTAIIFVFPNGELYVEEIKGFGQNEMFGLFRDNWLNPYQNWKYGKIEIGKWKLAIEQTLEMIYEKLISRVHQILKEKSDTKEVLFVPNQSLALLPLHAASWKDTSGERHYLLEEYTISYAPSVSVFKRCRENEKQRTNKTLFVTNPNKCDTERHNESYFCAEFEKYGRYVSNLRFSEAEVSSIEKIQQPYNNLLGKDATKSIVTDNLQDDYGFTHFSCHGSYKQENFFESGLEMSDETMKLSEIINCNLQSNWLTTLSACETGMVDFASPTDEHFGLPLGFIFAGSPSVWASLWSVSDLATSELMRNAYENLSAEEYKSKPEALRQAQLSMLNDKGAFPHPFFWAGFQHFGV